VSASCLSAHLATLSKLFVVLRNMRCYYEELELQRNANDGDIKSAYRKMALRWHPDKNPDRLAEAKERFQLIQQAYEVLSDPQERSWYDNHREQILRGKNSDYAENCLDVFQFFTSSCYKGYGDDEHGFYRVYTDVFVQIASEDLEFMDKDDRLGMAPDFGHSNSSYEDVVGPFYAFWQAYSTRKTYDWLCPYDVREIKERFILRKVEKEMKKIVQAARKERNEEVGDEFPFFSSETHFTYLIYLGSQLSQLCAKKGSQSAGLQAHA